MFNHITIMGIIYQSHAEVCKFSHPITLLNQVEKLESINYSAAWAVFGAWRGTSWEGIHWAWLGIKGWVDDLLFYKFIKDLIPGYTIDPIPSLPKPQHSFHNQDVVGWTGARTEKHQCSFHPNCLTEQNKLDPKIRLAPSVAVFKRKVLVIICPPCKTRFQYSRPNRSIPSH